MKPSPFQRGTFLAVAAGVCLFSSVSQAAVTVVGSGNDSSFLVLESPGLGSPRTYEIRYTYASGTGQDAYFLLQQVVAGDASVNVSYANYGTPSAPNYFVNSINGETNTATPPYLYWAQWVAGGKGFQNPDYTYNPGDVADGSWSIGFGISTHFIEPGSWDALIFSDGNVQPTIAPVPETSSTLLGMLGTCVIFLRRRRA